MQPKDKSTADSDPGCKTRRIYRKKKIRIQSWNGILKAPIELNNMKGMMLLDEQWDDSSVTMKVV